MDDYTVRPIGVVRSSLADRESAPSQGNEGAPDAVIEIHADVAAGLDGIEAGHELIVLTWFHESRRDVLTLHPRWDPGNPLTGVFNTRSPDRPNPIGMHRVRVVAVDGPALTVGPLEAIDGTPVVDLKPVLSASDREP